MEITIGITFMDCLVCGIMMFSMIFFPFAAFICVMKLLHKMFP